MRTRPALGNLLIACACFGAESSWQPELGRSGGQLVIALRAEPKTFNPVLALDAASRDVIRRMMADLITINRLSQTTEPSLAESWKASPDGLHYTLTLRQGVKFSDGHPFDASDVVFSFQVYLDEKIASPQRDLLIIGGRPIAVTQLDTRRVRFDFAAPYAAAERIFDSLAMLPRHLLERAYQDGQFASTWNLGAAPTSIVGLGPFRLKRYLPGERVVLERNPHYWKLDRGGKPLPYLDELHFVFVPAEEAQIARFVTGDTQMLSRFSARGLPQLPAATATDLGPSLEYNFLFFNLGAPRQDWFRSTAFRRAVSAAIDRDAIVKLVFNGRAAPLWNNVPPGNRRWVNDRIAHAPRSLDRARQLLHSAGFSWNAEGALLDPAAKRVEFSLLTSASNQDRVKMATIIQEDLRQLGMEVRIASLEQRAVIDRVLNTRQYDAALMALGAGDADPNSEINVWLSSGATHLWNPAQKQPSTAWEAELDGLMEKQLITLDHAERKRLFDRVQQIVADELPIIPLASPHVLVAARRGLGNFRPAVLDHNTLWNAEYLYWRDGALK